MHIKTANQKSKFRLSSKSDSVCNSDPLKAASDFKQTITTLEYNVSMKLIVELFLNIAFI